MVKEFNLTFDFSNKNSNGSGGNGGGSDIDPNKPYADSPLYGYFSTEKYKEPTYSMIGPKYKVNGNYKNGLLGLDGNIYYMPSYSAHATYTANAHVLKIDTTNDTSSLMAQVSTLVSTNNGHFVGGIRLDNNKVFCPCSAQNNYSYIFDFNTNTSTNFAQKIGVTTSSNQWLFFTKRDNKIYGFPRMGKNIAIFDLDNNTATTTSDIYSTAPDCLSTVFHFNGLVYQIAKNIGVVAIDINTRSIVDIFGEGEFSVNMYSSVLHPNGKIYSTPNLQSSIIYEIDVVQRKITSIPLTIDEYPVRVGVLMLAPNGKLYSMYWRINQTTGNNYLSEIDIENGTSKTCCYFVSSLTNYSDSAVPFMHPNGKIYFVPKSTGTTGCEILIYDTGCPAKDSSIFYSELMNNINNQI